MSTGAQVIAKALKDAGITVIFGIVGIPIVEIADACILEGIRFIAFRNEQSASYAASIYGYLTNKPGVLLVVGGPGLIHSLAGIYNAGSNKWPLVVLAGSVGQSERGKGGFQELDQVSLMSSLNFVKLSMELSDISRVDEILFKGLTTSLKGVPGCCYIDIPADIIRQEVNSDINLDGINSYNGLSLDKIPKFLPDLTLIEAAKVLIVNAKFPLVILGKGASNDSQILRDFINTHRLPFIPTPMGKGIVSDLSEYNLSAARSKALAESDVILVVGARLNWILHFGEYPRFKKNVKFIQIDHDPQEVSKSSVGLPGDIGLTIQQLHKSLVGYESPGTPGTVAKSQSDNLKRQISKETIINGYKGLLSHAQALSIIRHRLEEYQENITFVSEGAKTMDFSRLAFELTSSKQRLDAGTNATMGVGLGYAISAKIAFPSRHIVAIEGDSAIGFSIMEIETAIRNDLPMLIIVLNNSGIYHGVANSEEDFNSLKNDTSLPSTSLSYGTRYDKICESLGGTGYFAKDYDDLQKQLQYSTIDVFVHKKVSLVNVMIQSALNEKLEFGWQNKKQESKL